MDALFGGGSRDAPKGSRSGFFGVVLGLAILFEDTLGDQSRILPNGALDLVGHLRIRLQAGFGVFPALAQPYPVERKPGARLLHHTGLDAEVDQFAHLGYAFAIHDVELNLLERRRDLILDHLDPRLVADHLLALLDRADTTNIEADGGVKLERIAARCRLGRTVHDANLHADLIDEDHHGVGARDRGGQLAQRLAHQPRLQAWLRFAHFAFDLGPWRQRRDRVDDKHVDCARTHQGVGDFKRLLASVGLGNQGIVEVDAEFACIDRIERMFGVNKGANSALLLRFRDHMQRERRLARGFWSINLDYPAARQAADAERDVEAERPRRHCLDFDRLLVLAQAHDRALAERPFDLRQGGVERLGLVHAGPFHEPKIRLGHNNRPSLTGSVRSAIAVYAPP